MVGAGSDYDGRADAALQDDVIVVTMNYRLDFLGFAGSEALRSRDIEAGSTGNYGIQASASRGAHSRRARAIPCTRVAKRKRMLGAVRAAHSHTQ